MRSKIGVLSGLRSRKGSPSQPAGVALLSAAVLVVVACGGSSVSEEPASTTTTGAQSSTSTPETRTDTSAPTDETTSTVDVTEASTTTTAVGGGATDFNREEFGPNPFYEDPCWLVNVETVEDLYGAELPQVIPTTSGQATFGICQMYEGPSEDGVEIWAGSGQHFTANEGYVDARFEAAANEGSEPERRPDVGDGGYHVVSEEHASVQFLKDGMYFIVNVYDADGGSTSLLETADGVAEALMERLPDLYSGLREVNPVSSGDPCLVDAERVGDLLGQPVSITDDQILFLDVHCVYESGDGSDRIRTTLRRAHADAEILAIREAMGWKRTDTVGDGSVLFAFPNGAGALIGVLEDTTYFDVSVLAPEIESERHVEIVEGVAAAALEDLANRQ